MNTELEYGDLVSFKSRKNGGTYIGFVRRIWKDVYGREIVSITKKIGHEREVANPFRSTVEKLTDEIHMLWKLENL